MILMPNGVQMIAVEKTKSPVQKNLLKTTDYFGGVNYYFYWSELLFLLSCQSFAFERNYKHEAKALMSHLKTKMLCSDALNMQFCANIQASPQTINQRIKDCDQKFPSRLHSTCFNYAFQHITILQVTESQCIATAVSHTVNTI